MTAISKMPGHQSRKQDMTSYELWQLNRYGNYLNDSEPDESYDNERNTSNTDDKDSEEVRDGE